MALEKAHSHKGFCAVQFYSSSGDRLDVFKTLNRAVIIDEREAA